MFIKYHSYFRQFHCKSSQFFWRYGIYIGSATCLPNFVEIGAQEQKLCAILYLVRRRKIRKFTKFQGLVSQKWLGLLLSNLVCKVLYMKALKYVGFVEIGTIDFEL